MKPHSILQAPVLAFYSRDFYREVAQTWRGTSFAYLLLLLVVCWLPSGWQLQSGWVKFVDVQSSRIVDQIPPISIKDGIVSVDAKQPCYITDPDTKKVLAIIDTTGQVASPDGTGALLFLGKDQVVVKKGAEETRVYSLSRVEDFHIDRDVAHLWLDRSRYVAGPFIYLMMVAGSYVFRVVEVLVLASIGAVLSREATPRPGFGALLGISVLAVTPSIIARTALDLAKVSLPRAWMASLIVSIAYLFYGIAALRATPGQQEGAPGQGGSQPPQWSGPSGPGGRAGA